jgi:transketolase
MSPFWIELEDYRRLTAAAAGPGGELARLRQLCACNRINALSSIFQAQHGWLGASFSIGEILTALYFKVMRAPQLATGDVLILGKGHAAAIQYAALAGLGLLPVADLRRYKEKDGPQAHSDISTPGVVTNSGSLGQALSKAVGMAMAQPARRFFVILGDGELQEGQNFEAFMSLRKFGLGNVTVIIDRNFIQSDSEVADIKEIPDLAAVLRGLGLEVSCLADGNDLAQVVPALERAVATAVPTVIIADTRKGAGVSFMAAASTARRAYKWHGGIPTPAEYIDAVAEIATGLSAPELTRRLSSYLAAARCSQPPAAATPVPVASAIGTASLSTGAAFTREMTRWAPQMPSLIMLDADLEKPCRLTDFATAFPAQFIEMGIAEQDMASTAGGLALAGRLPVVNTYASFMRRCFEQIYVNASEGTRIIYAGHYAGLCYATDGKTHQCTGDVAMMRSIPGMRVVCPAFPEELPGIIDWYLNEPVPGPLYLRLHRTPALAPLELTAPPHFRHGYGLPVRRHGGNARVLVSGPHLTAFAAAAVDQLLETGLRLDLDSVATLRSLAPEYLEELASTCRQILIIEENIAAGGLFDEVAGGLSSLGQACQPRLARLAPDDFTFSTRDPLGLYRHFGLDTPSLIRWLQIKTGVITDLY